MWSAPGADYEITRTNTKNDFPSLSYFTATIESLPLPALNTKGGVSQVGSVRRLFKDQFAHELCAYDLPNFRPIHISLHTLLVVYSSSLPEHFICFLRIFLK
jgi:hypothetical protein